MEPSVEYYVERDSKQPPLVRGRGGQGLGLSSLIALVGGAWAFAQPLTGERLETLALASALILAGWIFLWRMLTGTDWAAAFRHWLDWEYTASLPHWPYLQGGTPGARLYQALGQARSWWQHVGADNLARPLRSALLALVVALLLSAALGRTAVLLSFLFLTWSELTALWSEGSGRPGAFGEAVACVGLPWLLGASLSGSIPPLALLSALAVTLLFAGHVRPGWQAAVGPLLVGLFLLWQGAPLATGVVFLLAFPGLWLSVQGVQEDRYRGAVSPWLAGMLLVVAGVL
ncbi:MAG: hypothetical protein ACP5GX_01450 [Anaerolineae bacterium]